MSERINWVRRGLVFSPDGRFDWLDSYAQTPVVLPLEDRLRIYFGCRPKRAADGDMTSVISFLEVSRANPCRILKYPERPILDLGALGTFDQFGMGVGSVVTVGSEIYLYYAGWSRCRGVPYSQAIGLAVSSDGGVTFRRWAQGPLFDRSPSEPFYQTSPSVFVAEDRFHMIYCSAQGWVEHAGKVESLYVLTQASSVDGIHWTRTGKPCVDPVLDRECQANATVLRIGDRYHLWFSYRPGLDFRGSGGGYRIGHAWSLDLEHWTRDDEAGGLGPSFDAGAWDSQAVCYPRVVLLDGVIHMFYCGNDFGRRGFGLAVGSATA